jgi:uncharacterized protein YbjT (DUF2867 family)
MNTESDQQHGRVIAVTGATGFVGRYVVRRLLGDGWTVRILVRDRDKARQIFDAGLSEGRRLTFVVGGIERQGIARSLVEGCDACIHLIGIIREYPRRGITFEKLHVKATERIVAACEHHEVPRYVHMSALGARPDAPSVYHQTKAAAEAAVHASGLNWTIIQPSLIIGADGEFTDMARAWASGSAAPWLFMPYFGTGLLGFGPKRRIQPVAVEDVADCFVNALDRPATIRQIYELAGGTAVTWPDMLRAFRDTLAPAGRWRPALPLPAWYALTLAELSRRLGAAALLPFDAGQVRMACEDSICDVAAVRRDLDVDPRPFADILARLAPRESAADADTQETRDA